MEQINQHYPFVLPPLPYAYNALEPYVDARTMQLHHDKHLATYINNLNSALESYPPLQTTSLTDLIKLAESKAGAKLPAQLRTSLLHNAGGVYNHIFFFDGMQPSTGQITVGQSARLRNCLTRDFGGIDNFKSQFNIAAADVFGSGYAWLVAVPSNDKSQNANHKLMIVQTKNQLTPLPHGYTPLLCIDVWEHAYYLKHQNVRSNWISAFWNVVDWAKVSARLEEFCIHHDCVG